MIQSRISVRGLVETRTALAKFAPDLLKESDAEMRVVLKEVVATARGYVEGSPLSGWSADKGRKITKRSSMFSTRSFPQYREQTIRSGLKSKIGRKRATFAGWFALYSIQNNSRAGAIYETAGRKNPNGARWGGSRWGGPSASRTDHDVSHSNNPNAGKQFIDAIERESGFRKLHKGKRDGRLAFRAVEENETKVVLALEKSINSAVSKFNARTNAFIAFGGE